MRPGLAFVYCLGAAWTAFPACHGNASAAPPTAVPTTTAQQTLVVTSSAFADGGRIPDRFTCSGAGVSPGLSWTGTPHGAMSIVLIVDDPDAPGGTFTHWLLYGLPASTAILPEAYAAAGGATEGRSDFGKPGYGGPCPPPGTPHHYRFQVLALDAAPDLPPDADRDTVDHAVAGHVLASGTLTGLFSR